MSLPSVGVQQHLSNIDLAFLSTTMPKIVSKAIVSSSEQAALAQSARAVLRSYYCLCGDFVLVLQGKLDRLPRRRYAFYLLIISAFTSVTMLKFMRRTDGAYIIRSKPGSDPEKQPARKFKLNAQPAQRCLLKR